MNCQYQHMSCILPMSTYHLGGATASVSFFSPLSHSCPAVFSPFTYYTHNNKCCNILRVLFVMLCLYSKFLILMHVKACWWTKKTLSQGVAHLFRLWLGVRHALISPGFRAHISTAWNPSTTWAQNKKLGWKYNRWQLALGLVAQSQWFGKYGEKLITLYTDGGSKKVDWVATYSDCY